MNLTGGLFDFTGFKLVSTELDFDDANARIAIKYTLAEGVDMDQRVNQAVITGETKRGRERGLEF